jgi:hypothetical protein
VVRAAGWRCDLFLLLGVVTLVGIALVLLARWAPAPATEREAVEVRT